MTHYIYRNRKMTSAHTARPSEKKLSCLNAPHNTSLLHAPYQPCVEGGFALIEKYVKRNQSLLSMSVSPEKRVKVQSRCLLQVVKSQVQFWTA